MSAENTCMHHVSMSLKTGKYAGSDLKKVNLMKVLLHKLMWSFRWWNNNTWTSAALQPLQSSPNNLAALHTRLPIATQPSLTPHTNRQQKAL